MTKRSTKISSKKLRVFLAHSSTDKPYVREFYHLLRLDGFQPWLDTEDLVGGQLWEREIEQAVQQTDAIVLFLSRRAVTKNGYVHKEMAVALEAAQRRPEGTIFILPLLIEECDVPVRLNHLQRIRADRTILLDARKSNGRTAATPALLHFSVGRKYLELQRALLACARQRKIKPRTRVRTQDAKLRLNVDEFLVRGCNRDKHPYYGTALIKYSTKTIHMWAIIESKAYKYSGSWIQEKLVFTGAHKVRYFYDRGFFVGTWGQGGMEELIPASLLADAPSM